MQTKKKIAFHTLGCKLNFSETSSIARQFHDGMYEQVGFDRKADIYVINSCSVTQSAEKRCRALVAQAIRTNPKAHVTVIGCYSQLSAESLRSIPGVSLVLGNTEKFRLAEQLAGTTQWPEAPREGTPVDFVPAFSSGERTRSFFKIQDGCDYQCAYCTIPMARGPSRSNTIASTIKTAENIVRENFREVVLTGVNIGDFGKPHGETFLGLLKALTGVKGLERIRLSSVEPDLLHDNIIRLVANHKKLMPHFHIPLQSGSDAVLRSMGRRYDTALFLNRVETIRRHLPHACIAVDLIVGYPGESEAQFLESKRLLSQADISYIHVFTYSERANTRAIHNQHPVSPDRRKLRSQELRRLSDEKKHGFIQGNRGLHTSVLWEKAARGAYLYGLTENYIRAKTPYTRQLAGQIQDLQLNKTDSSGVYLIDGKKTL